MSARRLGRILIYGNLRYLLDLDGNAFSGRYLGLFKTGSLIFKVGRSTVKAHLTQLPQSTVFTEFFHDWLLPFEHYIPVLPDLSDLTDRIEWAIKNDAEAHRIQEAGKLFAERVLTDAQNDAYFWLVLLEWGRLWGGEVEHGNL